MHTDLSLGYCAARARRDPRTRLREELFALARGQATIVSHDARSWASITFAGTRHRVDNPRSRRRATERRMSCPRRSHRHSERPVPTGVSSGTARAQTNTSVTL